MDRICNTANLERYIELSITIDNPYIPIELRDVDQLGTLGTRVDCIHYIPVAQCTLSVRDIGGKFGRLLTLVIGAGQIQCRKSPVIESNYELEQG